jgi:7,8-dihydroneopterin aldolase/epimerase/oxygenase
MTQAIIRVRRMRFWGRAGVTDKERENPQEIEIDAEVRTGRLAAVDSDDIRDTIDYRTIYDACERAVTGRVFALLEALADACLTEILSDRRALQATIRARKPGLLDGATPEVELTRTQSE